MPDRTAGAGRSRRSPRRLLPLTVACVATVAIALVGTARTDAEPAPEAAASAASPDVPPTPTPVQRPSPAHGTSPTPAAAPVSGPLLSPDARPVALRIPSIGVDAPMTELGLNADRTLEVPADTVHTGWYGRGPRPGETGPAVIAGHVDSKAGPGVFFRLRELEAGARIEVAYDDGSLVTFTVTEVSRYDKDHFPTARIYGDTPDAQLRLITCGGTFDSAEGHYRDNVVAFATLHTER